MKDTVSMTVVEALDELEREFLHTFRSADASQLTQPRTSNFPSKACY